MHLLVTGAAGFIGSNFVRRLLTDQYNSTIESVTVLDKLTYAGNLANLEPISEDPRYRFVEGDIAEADDVKSCLDGIDVVVNFAAESHVDRSINGPAEFIRTNIAGAQTVFEACREQEIERIVHIGTDEVYGTISSGSWTEESPLLPNSPYSAAKASAELLARAYHRTYGMNISTTRCSNNYGPYQFPEKIIPLFVTNLIDGKKVPVYGTGENVRDWLHVDDHCDGIWTVLSKGEAGESYNIGGGTELNNLDLTRRILKLMNADDSSITWVEDRLGHDLRYSVDDTKVRKLGYTPKVDLEAGLEQTVQWYLDNESWWRPILNQS